MYTITFKCPTLTGDKIHTIVIADRSLVDTWASYDLGETNDAIINALREKIGNTHDVNVYFDTNDDDRDELRLCLYTMYIDEDDKVQTDHNNWIVAEILSVKGEPTELPDGVKSIGGDEFINDGEDYFYYNENWDKVECPCCERSCYIHDIERDANGKIIGCTDCIHEETDTDEAMDAE